MQKFEPEKNPSFPANQNEEDILKRNRYIFRKGLFFFLMILLVGLSYTLGLNKGKSEKGTNTSLENALIKNKSGDESVDFSLFWNVWNIVKEKHIDRENLDAQKMVYGAINGMLKATGDPYTSFFDPEDNKYFAEDLEGSFEGIGAELDIRDNILTIVTPLENSPAEKAGLHAGDKILKIGDKIVSDMTIDEAVSLIRGKKGTEVTLTVLSNEEEEAKDITIVRNVIEIKTVKLEMKENNIVYLRINKFGENTDGEFDEAVDELLKKNAKGLVLDLRNNPGGLLDKAVLVASQMIPKGKIVTIQEDSQGKRKNLNTIGYDRLSNLPTVVLINEGSASASEILAGALRDNRQITLIGTKSFGKGTVQELINLTNGSSVKVTIAKWLTPNGESISEKGIIPDIEVKMTREDYENKNDLQLEKAMELIRQIAL